MVFFQISATFVEAWSSQCSAPGILQPSSTP